MAQAKTKTKAKAGKNLVIVESPSKAKTIGKFLGSNYKVLASVGHVRDLPASTMGIDIENDYEPKYITVRGKGPVIQEMKKEAKKAKKIFLATDPDREGEAISWHLAFLLGIDPDTKCRIAFNEITKEAVKGAVKEPRMIDMHLVDAQQARRVLDRLVGYSLSELVQRKIRWGLSAGRVQSAALKIICDREDEIKAFVPEEYWTIEADFEKEKPFTAKLTKKDGKKLSIGTKEEADSILADLKAGTFTVESVEESARKKNPQPPFTTSSMQQDAGNKLNFNATRTMRTAQQLYEGVDIKGRGTIGLITYIRTDSVRVSDEARAAAKGYIGEKFGEAYCANNVYKNRRKETQDAHEAIRPSYVDLRPEDIKDQLSQDQYRLYRLIWQRFVASQMAPAVYDRVQAGIKNGSYMLNASGSKLRFDGFMKVYSQDKNEDTLIPALEKGEVLDPKEIRADQNFTQPPARFTESSLVKDLEEKGIGRPSTYAPILSKLQEKKYVKREKKTLFPTDLGYTVTHMMEDYFKEIVDAGFTAGMEEKLDDIEVKDVEWKQIIRDFYGGFEKELKYADEHIKKPEDEVTDILCEKCGKPMVKKHGRFGEFLACSGYPGCRNTKNLSKDGSVEEPKEELTDILCEECGKPMIKKRGRFGEFLACSGYPECKNTKNLSKDGGETSTGIPCPVCGKDIVERRGRRRGKVFYGCSGYPDCKQIFWYKPTKEKCPKCGSIMMERSLKSGEFLQCSNEECGNRIPREGTSGEDAGSKE